MFCQTTWESVTDIVTLCSSVLHLGASPKNKDIHLKPQFNDHTQETEYGYDIII